MSLNVNDFPLMGGNLINSNGEVENIVDTLQTSASPVNNTQYDINSFPVHSGNIIGSDGQVYNIVDIAGEIADDIEQLQEDVETLSSATLWKGVTTTPLTDKATTIPIELNGESVVPENGWVVEYNSLEFAWNGSCWEQFGASSYEQLTNKPSINGVTLSGNKTSADLGLLPNVGNDIENEIFYLGRDSVKFTTQRSFGVESDNGAELSVNNGVDMTSTDGSTLNVGRNIAATADHNVVLTSSDNSSITLSDDINISAYAALNLTYDSGESLTITEGSTNVFSIDDNGISTIKDITTSNTTFTNTSLVTKNYVDTNTLQEAIVDVTVLPTGSNIKDVVYRLATTVGQETTYSYYMGDSVNQTTTQITDKVYIDALAATKLNLSGGSLTGDVTTTNTIFGNTSLVTKQYVSDNTINESIVDVTVLPTGSNIKDVIYRLATTVDNTTTYTYYMGDSTNQTTTQITDKVYIDTLAATKLNLSGGILTGDVTTTNTTFGNTSLVTKNYVDTNTINEAITDTNSLPTGANIKDMVYRLATTVDNTTTYTYYMGDSVNQSTVQIPTMADINALNANNVSY